MTNYDFSPLYRSAIGFERLANLLSNATRVNQGQTYPPYNIEVTGEDDYRITMAIAGLSDEDIEITSEQNTLTVVGKNSAKDSSREFLYQGIAERGFERRFQLADHVRVVEATIANGLLHVDLHREIPEAMKPQKIEIKLGKYSLLEGENPGHKDAA